MRFGGLSIPGASFPGGRYNLSRKIRSESEASNLEALDPVIGKESLFVDMKDARQSE